MPSSDLWYPGRIPLCTSQVVRGLTLYLEALRTATEREDTNYILVAGHIHEDIHKILYAEGLDCLGSDTDINDLLALLEQTQQAVEACAQRNAWDDLEDVIDAIDTVRWSLMIKQNGGGTDDGEQPGAVTTPNPHERPTDGSDSETDPGEEHWSDRDVYDQFKAEEALPLCDDENEDEDLTEEQSDTPLLSP